MVTGGDDNAFSIGKAIERYNPSVAGLSHGSNKFAYCYGPICPSGSIFQPFNPTAFGLNAAQSGAWVTKGNINNQFKYLDRYYSQIVCSNEDPWKLMVFLMGFNNMCLGCMKYPREKYFNADKYEKNVRYAIEKLRTKYSKMIVVLLAPFHVSTADRMVRAIPTCMAIQKQYPTGCMCGRVSKLNGVPMMDELATQYADRLEKIAFDYQSHNDPLFNVMYDPGLAKLNMSDSTIQDNWSGGDCFHPIKRTHERLAVSLWNNLMKPYAQKQQFGIVSHQESVT